MNKKFFYLLLIINLSALNLIKAQSANKAAFSLGTEVAFPFQNYRADIGFNAKAELPLFDALKLTFSAGYSDIIPENKVYTASPVCESCSIDLSPHSNPGYKYIPVKAGLRYYYLKRLYVDGDAGAAFKADNVARTSFIYGFGLGGIIPFNMHNALDIGVRFDSGYKSVDYNSVDNQIGIGVAYKYQF